MSLSTLLRENEKVLLANSANTDTAHTLNLFFVAYNWHYCVF